MMDYITKIRANVSIYTTRKTSNILDGAYRSIYMGRSLNFEDLREYIPGDNIRDIDWKASSRSRNLLVKRYIAEKKHNIMLVFDSGLKMSGDTRLEESKKETALYVGGTIAYIAFKNGDNVGALYNSDGLIQFHQLKTGLYNVEKILSSYQADALKGKKNSISKTLNYIINNFRRKMIIFVITDAAGASEIDEGTLKRLYARHDVLFVTISDADITGARSFDLDADTYIPNFVTGNKKLIALEQAHKKKISEQNERKFLKFGISAVEVNGKEEIVTKVTELLEKHRYANVR